MSFPKYMVREFGLAIISEIFPVFFKLCVKVCLFFIYKICCSWCMFVYKLPCYHICWSFLFCLRLRYSVFYCSVGYCTCVIHLFGLFVSTFNSAIILFSLDLCFFISLRIVFMLNPFLIDC
jgi:hypothetical protein